MRLNISLSNEIIKRLDVQAERLGVPRASLISTWLGEKLDSVEMSRDLLNNMFSSEEFKEVFAIAMKKKIEKEEV